MEMVIKRNESAKGATEGRLYVNGDFECFTLEDQDRALEAGGVKVQNETAIPKGMYEVAITPSARFKRKMPELLNVPNFKGVRIHSGNTKDDTEGCILVGALNERTDDDFIGASRVAFSRLYPKIEKAIMQGEKVTLTIV